MRRLSAFLFTYFWVTLMVAQQCFFYGTDRLPSSLITTLAMDANGLLWVGTEQGLSSFDGYRFTPHILPTGQLASNGNDVSSMLTDTEGRLWVGTATGLLLHDRATDAFLPISFPDSISPRVASLVQLRDGQLLAGTAGYGLYEVHADSLTATRISDAIPASEGDYFSRLYEAQDGSLWKSGPTEQIICRRPNGTVVMQKGRAEAFYEWEGEVRTATLPQTCAVKDAQGNIFIGTRGEGLFWIPRGQSEPRRMDVVVEGFDLSRARVNALLSDHAGRLWVGCHGRGLLQLNFNSAPLLQRWSFSRQGWLTGTCVSSIVEGTEGTVWCVVQAGGIFAFDRQGRITAHPQAPKGVESLMTDADGRFFVGTNDGLYSYEPSTGQSRLLFPSGGHYVNTLADLGDKLAVSTFGAGCSLIDKRTGQVRRQLTMRSTDTISRGRLCNDWIYVFDTDRRGRLWIGTASGVSCYNPDSDSFRTEGWEILNDGTPCTALRVLHSGQTRLSSELSIPGGITYMAEDAIGELWVATTDGLYRFAKGDTVATAPLVHTEFVQGAGLQTSDGRILLGTSDGLLVFHPDSVRNSRGTAQRVRLTALRIGSEVATMQTRAGHRAVMDSPVMECRFFSFPDNVAAFQLEFSQLDFGDPAATTFQYRMAGDSHWQQVTEGQNVITFNHLAPGQYRLQVRALSAGLCTEVEEYVLEVRPPWWRSSWAYFVYFLLALLLAASFAWAYRRHVQHQSDREKLHLLLSAIHAEETPLTPDDMRRALSTFVQNRQRQHNTYGNAAVMVDRLDAPAVRSDDEALMDRVIQSVNRHLSDSEFTTEQLCEEAGLSRAQLHRKMKEITGLPASEFIRGIRLEQAARMLRERKMGIAQVAYSVGFATAGHFSTVFKKHFGVTPSQFMGQTE